MTAQITPERRAQIEKVNNASMERYRRGIVLAEDKTFVTQLCDRFTQAIHANEENPDLPIASIADLSEDEMLALERLLHQITYGDEAAECIQRIMYIS
jgi:hypothetical protein